jgi:hypothetical protein
MVAVAGRVVGDVTGGSPDDGIVDAIIIEDHQVAQRHRPAPLNTQRRRDGGAPGGFGTRTSPERPRFRAFWKPADEVARFISHAKVAAYVETEAVSLP